MAFVDVVEVGVEFGRGKDFGGEIGFLEGSRNTEGLDTSGLDFGDEKVVLDVDLFGALSGREEIFHGNRGLIVDINGKER